MRLYTTFLLWQHVKLIGFSNWSKLVDYLDNIRNRLSCFTHCFSGLNIASTQTSLGLNLQGGAGGDSSESTQTVRAG